MQPPPLAGSAPACAAARPPAPPVVELSGVTRVFGGTRALDAVSLSVQAGEFFSLLGPSGCGKTTLLRLIAGLDFPDAGRLWIEGADAISVPPHLRPVNTVFQSYALFPHMTVWENVAFGLKMRKTPRPEIERRVARMLGMMRIEPLAQRRPAALSGGEKQRTALARAVVNEPRVLLLDEPLGALDLKLRRQLQTELRDLQRRLGITFIHVTHDQDEALTLSDRVAVMNAGRIEQTGAPEDLYERPRNRFVASFLGGCNLIDAAACPAPGGGAGAWFGTSFGVLRVEGAGKIAPGPRATLAIRPEKIVIEPPGALNGASNQATGVVEEVVYAGAETHYQVRCGESLLRVARMNLPGQARLGAGAPAVLGLPAGALAVLED